jgi:DNA-nicking Smr family endonuclease
MSTKKTDNNDNDFALFRQEVRDAKPLNIDKSVRHERIPAATQLQNRVKDEHDAITPYSDMVEANLVGNEEYLEYQGPGIQHKTFAKLRSGKIHIEAELDLHGMTLAIAQPTLDIFIEQCQQQRIRYIRLVHGKGWSSKDNKPVLKSSLNQWLRRNTAVLAFCSATVADGGAGALYVMLRRIHQT